MYIHTHTHTCMHAYVCDEDLCTMKPIWITIEWNLGPECKGV